MLIKSNSWILKKNSDSCQVWEYPKLSSNLSCAKALIDGRFPDKWMQIVNKKVEEIYFVLSGNWIIYSELWEFNIEKWDTYHFIKWEKYFVIWNKLEILLINSPERFPEQAEYIDL